MGNSVTTWQRKYNVGVGYQQLRQEGREALRRAVLDAAAGVLDEEGPSALTVRAVAERVGASTKVVYTMFGGKAGLVDELFREGFARLEGHLREASGRGAGPARVRRMARAYRAFALGNRAFYDVMYGSPIREFLPTPESRAMATASLGVLREAVGDDDRARLVWAAMHGVVSLELQAWLSAREGEAMLDRAVDAALAGG
jgi:AcrR family transcriptional regulator